jgi:hypothetical protein
MARKEWSDGYNESPLVDDLAPPEPMEIRCRMDSRLLGLEAVLLSGALILGFGLALKDWLAS